MGVLWNSSTPAVRGKRRTFAGEGKADSASKKERELLLEDEAGECAASAGGVIVDDAGLIGTVHALT